jgi:hypothetical protein
MSHLLTRDNHLVYKDGHLVYGKCTCNPCIGGEAPEAFLIEIAGVVHGSYPCPYCSEANGSFVVPYKGTYTTSGCKYYSAALPHPMCPECTSTSWIQLFLGGGAISVGEGFASTSCELNGIAFSKTLTAPYDCFASYELTPQQMWSRCDVSVATCKVTGL